jgi:tyrosinase
MIFLSPDMRAFSLINADLRPDPIFFLHHSNLDRIWYNWQQMDPTTRIGAYGGIASSLTSMPASLDDTLSIGGLLEPLPVSSVMETTSGLFCYRY